MTWSSGWVGPASPSPTASEAASQPSCSSGCPTWSCSRRAAERAAASGVEYVAFDDLFPRADVLFISPILSDLTRGIVGAAQLGAMKPTSYLVNISRGPIVQEAALVDALQRGVIRGAGLDVYDEEPLPDGHPLTRLDNVVLTPHIGWVTAATFTRFVEGMIDNAINYLDGNPSKIANPDALKVRRGSRAG